MILESVEHGTLIWPTVKDNGVIRTKKYAELSGAENIQADCDMKATNIILQGLPNDIYSLVNHHRVAKDLWERVQLLMQGTSLTKQERECKLYDAFDKFTHIKGESLHTLPPEWSKFVTDVKLVKDLHTSNFDQLHTYLKQYELHANEVHIMRERNQDLLSFIVNQQMTPPHFNPYQSSYNNPPLQQQFSPSQYGSIQPNQQYSSHYPSQTQFNHSSIRPSHTFQSQMNHQTSTIPQVIPQVAYQSPQAHTQPMTESPFGDSGFDVPVFSHGDDPIACLNKAMDFLTAVASSRGDKGKIILVQHIRAMLLVQGEIQQVDKLELLNATTAKDLDTYDSNCNDLSTAQAVLMANISNYGSDIISEIMRYLVIAISFHILNIYKKTQLATVQDTNLQAQQDSMILSVIEQMSEQMINHVNNWEKANKEQNNESITAELERYKERVKTFEQRLNIDLSSREKMIDSQMDDMIREKLALKEQIDSLEQNLSKQIKEKESLFKTFSVFKNESKEKENKYMENEIDLEKKIKELDNIICKVGQSAQTVHMLTKPQAFYDNTHKQALGYQNPFYLRKAQRMKPTLYDGVVMSNTHVAMHVIDDEETLILEEEMDVPGELPKVSLVNASLKNIKFHLIQFDSVVKKRTTPSALEEGEWGFEHTKAVFNNKFIPFLKSLKDIFNVFDKDLLNEITEVQTIFDQMEVSIQQFLVDKKCLEIDKKEMLLENDRLLQKIMSQDVILTMMYSMSLNNDYVNMEMKECESCEKCLNLDAELSKSKQAYNDFLKNYSQLEKHCICLEASMQLQQEVFQYDESCVNQNAVEIQEYFEINDLKAQLQDKDKTICKLKATIKSLRENTKEENVNLDKCDLEPINKELENSVANLLSKNERLCKEINHVKQVFKDQFDSIKRTRVRYKELSDSLINKLNLKSVENEDLKAQIQDKVFVITSLKNDLRKLKGKEIIENVVHTPSATTIAPGMFKFDLEPLPPRIQELLVYLQDTCPNAITPSAKKVTVKPNVKKVRFAEPLTSSSKIQQVKSSNTSDSNIHVLSSTGVKCSTSNCGSKPPGNKKNFSISQTPSRNKKNKVEAQPRKVNKVNRVVKPVCDVDVKHSLSKANSEILCATCNKSMFDGVHDKCLLDLVQNGNNRTKSAKKHRKQNVWKPTGHVFTEVGFKWKLTGRTFTIVGNSCPLTRFTSTNVVPPKQTTSHSDEIQKPEIKVYSRKPKNGKNIGSSKIAKIVESKNANHSEPNQIWGSTTIDISSSSSLVMTGCPDCTLVSRLWLFETYDRESLSTHELSKDGIARGIPRLKFQKGHLCLACALGKSRKSFHQPKAEDTNQEKLYLLHMDLCGLMRVASINRKWRNRTLVKAAQTMLIFSKALLFLWAEAINTACYTQNRSLICLRYNKTPYELMHDKKPDLSFFHVFGSLCYPINDNEDLGKFDAKANIGIFVGYAPAKKAFRIYNRRTRIITETIHVTFDELTAMV
ncbi:retrovirus-related pol polyprotein from transposon TNT 1-94 [Tanacetum coccineum]